MPLAARCSCESEIVGGERGGGGEGKRGRERGRGCVTSVREAKSEVIKVEGNGVL